MPRLHVRHRGKRGLRILRLASGASITLAPGDEKTGLFTEEYAETLRQRSSRGLDVEVRDVDEEQPPPVVTDPVVPLDPLDAQASEGAAVETAPAAAEYAPAEYAPLPKKARRERERSE